MINLKIMTPDHGVCFNQEVLYVDVVTAQGHIGLQANIVDMVAALKNAHCIIKLNSSETLDVLLCGGTLTVKKPQGIKIFTKMFAKANEVNETQLTEQITNLENRLNSLTQTSHDYLTINDQINILKDLLIALKIK